jgi:hypothetical protein
MGKKIVQNQGDARPQAHDALCVDASKPAKLTENPDGYSVKIEKSPNAEPRTWNVVDTK